jgi:hypothetical protein
MSPRSYVAALLCRRALMSHALLSRVLFAARFCRDTSYEWVRNPFQNTPEDLSTAEKEIFTDFRANGEKKNNLVINHALNFGQGRMMSFLH